MEYLLLIYGNEAEVSKMSESEQGAMYQEFMSFTQSIHDSKNWVAGKQLEDVATATTVRLRDGKRLVTDGPFAETRDYIGDVYYRWSRLLAEQRRGHR